MRKSNYPYQKAYRQRHPERTNAQHMMWYAIKTGKIVRPDHCEKCKKSCKPQSHHNDYSKPFEVEYLCGDCHRLADEVRRDAVKSIALVSYRPSSR